jgi:hypothetical protein
LTLAGLWDPTCPPHLTHTVGCGKLNEDTVAAQGDNEGLPAHTAALCLSGHGALEHTHIFICKTKEEIRHEWWHLVDAFV